MASKAMSPNHREILSAQSSVTGQQEYLYSTSHALNVNVTGTSGTTPTSVLNGSVTVTTAGTRVQFPTNTLKAITVKADVANTGIIYLGNSTVTSANGFELAAGDTISFDIANSNVLYIDASANNQMVNWLGVV